MQLDLLLGLVNGEKVIKQVIKQGPKHGLEVKGWSQGGSHEAKPELATRCPIRRHQKLNTSKNHEHEIWTADQEPKG